MRFSCYSIRLCLKEFAVMVTQAISPLMILCLKKDAVNILTKRLINTIWSTHERNVRTSHAIPRYVGRHWRTKIYK